MRHQLLVLAVLLAATPLAAQVPERTPATVLPTIKPGSRLRIEAGNALMTGKLDSLTADRLVINGADGRSSIPINTINTCLLYTSPSPRDRTRSRMPSSA